MFDLTSILSRFPDFFNKRPDSRLGKLMRIFSEQLQELKDTNHRIREWRDIDKAEGAGLDFIGQNVRQPRGVATDEVYRVLLKSKIARNLSTGDINTIIRVLALALNADYKDIKIKEKWTDPENPEPAAISLISVPITRLNEVGMDPVQFGRIVQKTVGGGIRVESIELTGTFEFGTTAIQYDPNKGFSDVDGTTGGYFGSLYSPSTDQDLPI